MICYKKAKATDNVFSLWSVWSLIFAKYSSTSRGGCLKDMILIPPAYISQSCNFLRGAECMCLCNSCKRYQFHFIHTYFKNLQLREDQNHRFLRHTNKLSLDPFINKNKDCLIIKRPRLLLSEARYKKFKFNWQKIKELRLRRYFLYQDS